MDRFQQAMSDPTGLYQQPADVITDKELNQEQKIKVLKNWEYDAQELESASEQNMHSDNLPSMLSRIHQALTELQES